MGIKYGSTDVKYGKLFLLIIVLVMTLSEVSSGQRKMIDCRKLVFAPPCRGIAAKRDTQSHSSDVRFTIPSEDTDYFISGQKTSNSDLDSMNVLLGLLKKAITKNVDYDTGTNYLA